MFGDIPAIWSGDWCCTTAPYFTNISVITSDKVSLMLI
jgi:hypothetical protein